MVHENIGKMINEQIGKEFFSAYLYLDIANYYADKGLDGFSHWFRAQAGEELEHAGKFIGYLQDNNIKVTLGAIADPSVAYSDFRAPLAASLAHEKMITASIHEIYEAAIAAKEYRTTQFLDWFIMEQGEEEKSSEALITKYDLYSNDARALYMLNSELGGRARG